MDYQKFVRELSQLYPDRTDNFLQSKHLELETVLEKMSSPTKANIFPLLHLAVNCLQAEEVYCEIGCFPGATLVAALLNNPGKIAYAIEADESEEKLDFFVDNLSLFQLEDRVIFCQQSLEEFFFDLRGVTTDNSIGVYFYNGPSDYRSVLLGLLLVKSFLAPQALIVVNNTNYSSTQQAIYDFLAANSECQLILDLPTGKKGDRSFDNGIQILSWNSSQEIIYDWNDFSQNFHHQPIIAALYDLHFNFESNTKNLKVDQLLTEADLLINSGELEAAEKKYFEALEWDNGSPHVWHNLATLYYQKSEDEKALSTVVKSINLDSNQALSHYTIGLIQEKLGEKQNAAKAYQKAISLKADFYFPYMNLGNLLRTSNLSQAETAYREGIKANPESIDLYINLASLLIKQAKFSEAVQFYKQAQKLNPEEPNISKKVEEAVKLEKDPQKAQLFLGNIATIEKQYQKAIAHYQKYLETSAGDSNFYLNLGFCYQELNRRNEAIAVYRQGIEWHPNTVKLRVNLIKNLQEVGLTKEAIAAADRAVELLTNNLTVKLQRQQILPVIYNDTEEIELYRDRFIKYLNEIIETTSLNSEQERKDALLAITSHTNFFLQYQGKNDLELQEKYGNFVHKIMAANYPQWVKPQLMPDLKPGEKIRIGYVSSCFYYHSISKLFLGWFENHDKEKFQIYSYSPHNTVDQITEKVKNYSNIFRHIPIDSNSVLQKMEELCQQILADKLHVLVFLDLGIYAINNLLAGLKLAPIQCQTWAHPITSGIPTVDYFLSSDLMESENSQEHYSETLIKLPNLGIHYSKPNLPSTRKQRSDFQLKAEAIIYLSCQSIFKYLPQYDYIFAAIAKQIPSAQLAFLNCPFSERVTEQFRQRLQKAFAKVNLNSEEYCIILPRLNLSDYLSLNLLSDVFLDSLGWSGGNTSLEAIACNLPIVTCPGEFMRGRHSYGILQMLGVTETIATNEREYVDIAVRLGKNPDLRTTIVKKIKNSHNNLYQDLTCVRALEQFYQRVVKTIRSN